MRADRYTLEQFSDLSMDSRTYPVLVDNVSGQELEDADITQQTVNLLNFLERGRQFSEELHVTAVSSPHND